MKQLTLLTIFVILTTLFFQPIHSEENTFIMPKNPIVIFETTQGNFEVTLFPEIAPKACENFLRLAQKNYYNGTIFHRVIKKFMIQGGDPMGTGTGGQSIWGTNFEDEFSPKIKFDRPGLLAMANRGPKTNGSQFFITTIPTNWLDNKHTIFGEVTSGYDIVQKIEATQTGPQDRPVVEQKIIKITLKNPE